MPPPKLSPETHQWIAKWIYHIARHEGVDRDRRVLETVAAIRLKMGWTEDQARSAMAQVAADLSPKEAA